MVRRSAGLLLLLMATACGGSTSAYSGTSGAGGSDAGAEATTGGSAGSAGSTGIDAGGSDAAVYNPRADSGTIDAGLFDCDGMCCEGATHYCRIVSGGAAPIFGTPPEAGLTCSDAGTSTRCIPLPSQCVGAPSCACVGTQYGGACQCDSTGGGVTVQCYAP